MSHLGLATITSGGMWAGVPGVTVIQVTCVEGSGRGPWPPQIRDLGCHVGGEEDIVGREITVKMMGGIWLWR